MVVEPNTTKKRTRGMRFDLGNWGRRNVGPLLAKRIPKRRFLPEPGIPGVGRVIGTVEASFSTDHDILIVRGSDDFRRIMFKVTNAGLNLNEWHVWNEIKLRSSQP